MSLNRTSTNQSLLGGSYSEEDVKNYVCVQLEGLYNLRLSSLWLAVVETALRVCEHHKTLAILRFVSMLTQLCSVIHKRRCNPVSNEDLARQAVLFLELIEQIDGETNVTVLPFIIESQFILDEVRDEILNPVEVPMELYRLRRKLEYSRIRMALHLYRKRPIEGLSPVAALLSSSSKFSPQRILHGQFCLPFGSNMNFSGRAALSSKCKSAVDSTGIVVLHGKRGCGKTEIALHVAEALVGELEDPREMSTLILQCHTGDNSSKLLPRFAALAMEVDLAGVGWRGSGPEEVFSEQSVAGSSHLLSSQTVERVVEVFRRYCEGESVVLILDDVDTADALEILFPQMQSSQKSANNKLKLIVTTSSLCAEAIRGVPPVSYVAVEEIPYAAARTVLIDGCPPVQMQASESIAEFLKLASGLPQALTSYSALLRTGVSPEWIVALLNGRIQQFQMTFPPLESDETQNFPCRLTLGKLTVESDIVSLALRDVSLVVLARLVESARVPLTEWKSVPTVALCMGIMVSWFAPNVPIHSRWLYAAAFHFFRIVCRGTVAELVRLLLEDVPNCDEWVLDEEVTDSRFSDDDWPQRGKLEPFEVEDKELDKDGEASRFGVDLRPLKEPKRVEKVEPLMDVFVEKALVHLRACGLVTQANRDDWPVVSRSESEAGKALLLLLFKRITEAAAERDEERESLNLHLFSPLECVTIGLCCQGSHCLSARFPGIVEDAPHGVDLTAFDTAPWRYPLDLVPWSHHLNACYEASKLGGAALFAPKCSFVSSKPTTAPSPATVVFVLRNYSHLTTSPSSILDSRPPAPWQLVLPTLLVHASLYRSFGMERSIVICREAALLFGIELSPDFDNNAAGSDMRKVFGGIRDDHSLFGRLLVSASISVTVFCLGRHDLAIKWCDNALNLLHASDGLLQVTLQQQLRCMLLFRRSVAAHYGSEWFKIRRLSSLGSSSSSSAISPSFDGDVVESLSEVLSLRTQMYEKDAMTVICVLEGLAVVSWQRGDVDGAIAMLTQLERLCDSPCGGAAGAAATLLRLQYTFLKGMAVSRGRHDAAHAMDILSTMMGEILESSGEEHILALSCQTEMVKLSSRLGHHEEALAAGRRLLLLRRQLLGGRHPKTLKTLQMIASALTSLQRSDKGMKLHRKVYKLFRSSLGKAHLITLQSLSLHGSAMVGSGKPAAGLKLHEEVLSMRRKMCGPSHPLTISAMHNIGITRSAMRDHIAALSILREVLDMRQQVLGEMHVDTLTTLSSLGACLACVGKMEESVAVKQKCLTLRQSVLGPLHPDTLSSLSSVGVALSAVGRHGEALVTLRRCLALYGEVGLLLAVLTNGSQKFGDSHPIVLRATGALCAALIAAKRLEDAAVLCEQHVKRCEQALGTDHELTMNAQLLAYSVRTRQQTEET